MHILHLAAPCRHVPVTFTLGVHLASVVHYYLGANMIHRTLSALVVALSLLAACASTEFKSFEGTANVYEGKGGTKVVVDGMEIWDNGEPPRKFKVIGIIDDDRPGGVVPMMMLRGDIVKKAKQAGGDAVIQLGSRSQITGYHTSSAATAYGTGGSTSAYGSATTTALRKNTAKFAVIRYVE